MNKLNHQQLVNIGLQWLYNNNMDTLIPKPDILTTELHTSLNEVPDILGFDERMSIKIEVKVSKADFNRDKNKQSFKKPNEAIGNFRYYLISSSFLTLQDLPIGWGLLVYDQTKEYNVRVRHNATNFFSSEQLYQNERTYLMAIIEDQRTIIKKLTKK